MVSIQLYVNISSRATKHRTKLRDPSPVYTILLYSHFSRAKTRTQYTEKRKHKVNGKDTNDFV